jgi:hypothetical protein
MWQSVLDGTSGKCRRADIPRNSPFFTPDLHGLLDARHSGKELERVFRFEYGGVLVLHASGTWARIRHAASRAVAVQCDSLVQ